jgi:hypothetical protein
MTGPKSRALASRIHGNGLPAARCVRATPFGKMDDMPFPSLRDRILI